MTVCHHCGQDIILTAEWGGLVVKSNGDAFWRGVKLPRMRPTWFRLLFVLAQRGEASHGALEITGSESFDARNMQVQICLLRRWLKANGVGVRIANKWGFGYALEPA